MRVGESERKHLCPKRVKERLLTNLSLDNLGYSCSPTRSRHGCHRLARTGPGLGVGEERHASLDEIKELGRAAHRPSKLQFSLGNIVCVDGRMAIVHLELPLECKLLLAHCAVVISFCVEERGVWKQGLILK